MKRKAAQAEAYATTSTALQKAGATQEALQRTALEDINGVETRRRSALLARIFFWKNTSREKQQTMPPGRTALH